MNTYLENVLFLQKILGSTSLKMMENQHLVYRLIALLKKAKTIKAMAKVSANPYWTIGRLINRQRRMPLSSTPVTAHRIDGTSSSQATTAAVEASNVR